jgi:hypothetical protein
MNLNAAVDLVAIRFHNLNKLFTKEDFNHIHKFIGFGALLHYIYRMYLFVTTGTMQFYDTYATAFFISLHAVLSLSSLIFKIPDYRIKSGPMIYPEFRLHSIVFALRSITVMLILFISRHFNIVFPLYLRGFVVIITMILADLITDSFKHQGTTMRGMPFPDYVTSKQRDLINSYYSISQIFATAQMIFCYRLDEAFLVLFPIQIAAFLMTCVRKSIISAGAWHFYYATALGLNYICCPFLRVTVDNSGQYGFFFPVAFMAIFVRFNYPKVNKYLIWSGATLIHIIAMSMFGLYKHVKT